MKIKTLQYITIFFVLVSTIMTSFGLAEKSRLLLNIIILCQYITIILLGVISLKFINLLNKKFEVNPVDYGWNKERKNWFTKPNGWFLYKSYKSWVLDKTPKDKPGVIERFGKNLTLEDIELINNLSSLKEVKHRKTSKI